MHRARRRAAERVRPLGLSAHGRRVQRVAGVRVGSGGAKLRVPVTRPLAALALLAALPLAVAGCAALQSLLGPAVTAAGAGLGAYEAQIAAAASAKGIPSGDPRVLAAVADAKRLAEKRAAEDKARDAAEARDLAAIRARLDATARPCVPVAPVDAGAEGGAP